MKRLIISLLFIHSVCFAANDETDIENVLDELHWAASLAQGDTYFSVFREDAVYIGTDANETWTLAEFKRFAEPYFSNGHGWTYLPKERHIYLSPDKHTAWFDELLWNEKYGTTRGTGVLIKTGNNWEVAQYHLAFPVPNELAEKVTQQIKQHRGKK